MAHRLTTILAWLERQHRGTLLTVGVTALLLIGLLDFGTGYELGFSIFYLIPVALVSWVAHGPAPLAVSGAAALTWLVADIGAGHRYSLGFIAYWNAGVRFGMFAAVGFALAALRQALERERALARTDPLTGAANPRLFRELAVLEIARARRRGGPMTLAYLDVDDFKAINDGSGHAGGDGVLQALAQALRRSVRATDHVARLGGDEFGILMPETDEASAREGIRRLQANLGELSPGGGPVSCSIGVVIFRTPPGSVDAMIRQADDLMYEVKRSGKRAARYRTVG